MSLTRTSGILKYPHVLMVPPVITGQKINITFSRSRPATLVINPTEPKDW